MGATSSSSRQPISGDDITRARAETRIVLPQASYHSTNYMMGSAEVELKFRQTYEMIRILGRGASAEVHLVRNRVTRQEYACKIVRKTNSMNDDRTMKTETTIMKKVEDNHLLRMYELYETEDTIWMILEYAEGGDVMHGLASLEVYSEREVGKIFKQILLGVKYLHGEGIFHRDLKLDNILFTRKSSEEEEEEEGAFQVKIADFGLSALTSVKRTSNNSQKMKSIKSLKEMWGTTEYFAPEVYEKGYGSQADIWALGCILFEMLTGELAFPHRESDEGFVEKAMRKSMLTKKAPRLFEQKAGWKELSGEAQSLIRGMLKRSAEKRFDIDECLSHPWLTGEGLTDRHDHDLTKAKRIIHERSNRRKKRYEALVEEVKRGDAHDNALSLIKTM